MGYRTRNQLRDPPGRCLEIRPELRDSDIERAQSSAEGDRTLYWHLYANIPPTIKDSHRLTRATFGSTVRACLARDIATVVIPEPLWVRYWPRTVAVVLLSQTARTVLRRKRFSVGLYAIDNLDPRERFTHPRLDGHRRLNGLFARMVQLIFRVSVGLAVDRIAFGTSQAELNYRDGGMLPGGRLETTVLPEHLGTCSVCFGPGAPVDEPREQRVLFLGELAERKGIDVLLKAWGQTQVRRNGWTLMLCGDGALSPAAVAMSKVDPTVSVAQPSRDEVHELLRTSAAVVLPSRRVPRWQEQVGLSMLEGEAHGCALIVSSDSGAARDLERRAGAQVVSAGRVDSLVSALDALPTAPRARPVAGDLNRDVRAFFVRGTRPAEVRLA